MIRCDARLWSTLLPSLPGPCSLDEYIYGPEPLVLKAPKSINQTLAPLHLRPHSLSTLVHHVSLPFRYIFHDVPSTAPLTRLFRPPDYQPSPCASLPFSPSHLCTAATRFWAPQFRGPAPPPSSRSATFRRHALTYATTRNWSTITPGLAARRTRNTTRRVRVAPRRTEAI